MCRASAGDAGGMNGRRCPALLLMVVGALCAFALACWQAGMCLCVWMMKGVCGERNGRFVIHFLNGPKVKDLGQYGQVYRLITLNKIPQMYKLPFKLNVYVGI